MANVNLLVTRQASGEFEERLEGKVRRAGQTLTCCHCGRLWEVHPGCGLKRGWCRRCGAPTCGRRGCQMCMPYMERIHRSEQRQALWRQMEQNRG